MGSSPGFGSNPNNIAGIAETPPSVSPLGPVRLAADFARGIRLQTCLHPLIALFGLAFASAPGLVSLNLAAKINSPAHSSIGTQSAVQDGLPRLVGQRFQVYFTPLLGYFSPFPHGTGSLSVAKST